MHYVMYGKGIVGKAMISLLDFVQYDYIWMDDADRDDSVLQKADKIIVTAGIPSHHDIYKKYGPKLMGELDLCYGILSQKGLLETVKFYCVTGTNGKSTTTRLRYNVLKSFYKDKQAKVRVCGNFEPALSEVIVDILKDTTSCDYHLVVEVSSFMCYQIKQFQSDYGIITNLATDHLNWHSDLDDYRQSKIKLFQHTRYACITDQMVSDYIMSQKIAIKQKVTVYKHEIDTNKTNFIGDHNNANLSAVYEVMKAIVKHESNGIRLTKEGFYKALHTIMPLPHRCQKGPLIAGLQFIDDLHATGTHAQRAALSCVSGKLILMCGGFDKGDNYDELLEKYAGKVAAGVVIGKSGKPFSDLFDKLGIDYVHTQDMKRGLEKAMELAHIHKTKTILYSPGCASFDLFRNRAHRAETFEKELKKIENKLKKSERKTKI